ncbi:MAG: D-alanyl-D-alanine carboxypeptidase/D-alanyl-D-alanine-endopeptidase [Bacteroidaceae bacterium]|nr:D-alanyl-D-alanine carboxypeptidase/D-alanyl-D-alanine-endopeptidase [Bacteroidaceae bacterium]
MKKLLRSLVIMFCLGVTIGHPIYAADSITVKIIERLDNLSHDSLLNHSQMAMMVYDLTADSMLFSHNELQLMRPASCQKVITSISALHYLGKDYQFYTSFYTQGEVTNNTLKGNLIVRGGFDPLFNYADMKSVIQALRGKGIENIQGNILLDVSFKDDIEKGAGWCWDDKDKPLNPLYYNGEPHFASALKQHLINAGIKFRGQVRTIKQVPAQAETLIHCQRPITEVLHYMMKDSDNLCAESIFYQLAARQGRPFASASDAIEHIEALIDSLGLNPKHYKIADGSGLSLYNYTTPQLMLTFLRYAYSNPNIYQTLLQALPIASKDGTLKKRMANTKAAGNVRAKTGAVTGISTLSGYCQAANGHLLCFTIFNQGVVRVAHGRAYQDKVCDALTRD